MPHMPHQPAPDQPATSNADQPRFFVSSFGITRSHAIEDPYRYQDSNNPRQRRTDDSGGIDSQLNPNSRESMRCESSRYQREAEGQSEDQKSTRCRIFVAIRRSEGIPRPQGGQQAGA